ncbi:MAG: hypothetical protein U1E40_01890 [Amaricoccus sp.]
MHVVSRFYAGPGAKELFDLLNERKADVEALLRGVDGLESYTLFWTENGGVSVTVCRDKAGTDESVRVAREWIAANAGHIKAAPPHLAEGETIVHI